jgi:RRXRR protein
MPRQMKQTTSGLPKARQGTSLALPAAGRARADDGQPSKPARQPRRENTGDRPGRMSASSGHAVFVLDRNGKPLTPTTPARARKLLEGGVAEMVWSKFGTFGIRMLVSTRCETPRTAIGVDHGTKFEGYSIVVGVENALNVKLDLPDKKRTLKKLEECRAFRRARRSRTCRRRPCRADNRGRKGFLAPSQKVIIDSRLKVIGELCRIYPASVAGVEDVCFNHAARRWGAHFSTVEVGKAKVREFFADRGINVAEYKGYETQELREGFGYRKTSDKSADRFESHCSDSLALACAVATGRRVEPGPFLAVDDTYRPVRRRLHDTQPAKVGGREPYSTGTVSGLRKGPLIGTPRGPGKLCGITRSSLRYYDRDGKRREIKAARWISSSFATRTRSGDPPVA